MADYNIFQGRLYDVVGEQVGHIIAVLVLSSAVFGIAFVFVKGLGPLPSSTLLLLGLFWLVLSLLFEKLL